MAKSLYCIAIVLALVTVWFIMNPVFYPDPCEECTNAEEEQWIYGSIVQIIDEWVTPTERASSTTETVMVNGVQKTIYLGACPWGLGPCITKFKYFPIDTAIGSVLFAVVGLFMTRRKKRTKQNEVHDATPPAETPNSPS